ncbi:UDP-galactose transporter [Elasticomyces elasticus]|uniref:UDP-galactose transporter homolog 1 n=1 Tax=Exophiala sideris TaxID=1016849 RepID=A0ABR0J0V0_9EURO|nr:UDP-galactose transporter [Elasticomyces elasticus]KAK5023834.1 UDP-galactose transporter [Exophiala sideris]KAK5030147.1 UDP-galactose transporter [Exophiala sideris]KAK5053642.1 UDP-galactose transporter [Exophiala sideris]KAK5179315.1 UDP-galactose transporter [Eurotiomycetes sp. CCFEE 6388]
MARRKQLTPTQRTASGEVMQSLSDEPEKPAAYTNGHISKDSAVQRSGPSSSQAPQPSILSLLICVSGIYASFLTWGLLQERITTTSYPADDSAQAQQEYFRFPIVLNTIQALFAFTSGSIYLLYKTKSFKILPARAALVPLTLVTLTTTLASPFGYASLAHVDYLTFVLAKSCKLLPVMALHVTLFRKRYPLSKYLIVLAVTSGVALFTLYHPPKPGKPASRKTQSSSIYGLTLLGINLLFDGLTNTVQDHIFQSPHRYGKTSGPQMMVILNLLGTLLMSAYLLVMPHIPPSIIPAFAKTDANELANAMGFLTRHPAVFYDMLGFAACGAIGQLFIYATLERFSSLLLVTVTVTRKMLTMVLSVVWFGKSLSHGQWMGVGLVFGGVAAEALIQQREKKQKERLKVKST